MKHLFDLNRSQDQLVNTILALMVSSVEIVLGTFVILF